MPKINPINMLKEDHQHVLALLEELASTTDRATKKRRDLLNTFITELKLHTRLEEELVYPAYFEAMNKKEDKELYYGAIQEHHVFDLLMAELEDADPSTPEFVAKVKVLQTMVEHHVQDEERDMFKRFKKEIAKEELDRLGQDLASRKEQLMKEQRAARRGQSRQTEARA